MSYVSVDVDIDDVLFSMSPKEMQQLVDDLYDDGYIPKALDKTLRSRNSDFDNACQNLVGQSWRLTKEEEEFIINLSKRFV